MPELEIKTIHGTNLLLYTQRPKPKYRVGDTIMLKSGGPLMTVVGCSDREVESEWFDNNRCLHGKVHHVDAVRKVKINASVQVSR